MRGRGRDGGIRQVHLRQQDVRLTHEQRKHLALKTAFAQCHTRQMIEIDRVAARRKRG